MSSIHLLLWVPLVLACGAADKTPVDPDAEVDADSDADSDADTDTDTDTDSDAGTDSNTDADTAGSGAPVDHCTEVVGFGPEFTDVLATWSTQDDAWPWPAGGLVAVGSSSIRRWEGLAERYSDHMVVQRGFGGAQLGEVALSIDDLVLRHSPAGIIVFAGTNDLAHGVDPDVVTERMRCFVQRTRAGLDPSVPIFFIGVTPTPARWDGWTAAVAFNEAVVTFAETDPALHYVDVPAAFLATGSPPDDSLFVDDGLHLSDTGYALWDSVLRPTVDAALASTAPAPTRPPASGARILVDLGASDGTNGEHTPSPDYLGQHWNNWHGRGGGDAIYPGERIVELRTDDGTATGAALVVTGGFLNNGREHGGLLWPDASRLGDLAVGTATEDYFYLLPDDQTGGLQLRGLAPGQPVTLRLFGSRDHEEVRVTRYTVTGATTASTTLQTSGVGAGTGTANDGSTAELTGVVPDAYGRVHIDVDIETGPYGYLGMLELVVE